MHLTNNSPSLRPAGRYEEAVERVERLKQRESGKVNPDAETILLGHDAQTDRAVVFFHGYTNCPPQFRPLGEQLQAQGVSVLIPRLPYHGYTDKLNDDQAKLVAQDLVDLAAEAIDIAHGLGREVMVSGISLGGVMAAWAAQYRADVSRVAVIAPFFGYRVVPMALAGPSAKLMLRLGDRFVWWDPKNKDNVGGPALGYPRFATHALAETLQLGLKVLDEAHQSAPAVRDLWMVTSAFDLSVSKSAINRVVDDWRDHGASVGAFEFGTEFKLLHDIIELQQPYARPDLVYPVMESILLEGRLPDPLPWVATPPAPAEPASSPSAS